MPWCAFLLCKLLQHIVHYMYKCEVTWCWKGMCWMASSAITLFYSSIWKDIGSTEESVSLYFWRLSRLPIHNGTLTTRLCDNGHTFAFAFATVVCTHTTFMIAWWLSPVISVNRKLMLKSFILHKTLYLIGQLRPNLMQLFCHWNSDVVKRKVFAFPISFDLHVQVTMALLTRLKRWNSGSDCSVFGILPHRKHRSKFWNWVKISAQLRELKWEKLRTWFFTHHCRWRDSGHVLASPFSSDQGMLLHVWSRVSLHDRTSRMAQTLVTLWR